MKASKRTASKHQPAPKEPKKKKTTLKEAAGTMLSGMMEKARKERLLPVLANQKAQEDEVASMMFGPSWQMDPLPAPESSERIIHDLSDPDED